MTGILHALEWINKYIFSPLLPILIFGAGIYFAFSLRFFCITHPVKFLRVFFPKKEKGLKRDKDSISPFKAVTLALAGTLGVGNIIGVSAAIMTGGFGSIFWMWCSAIAAMMVKYAEEYPDYAFEKNKGYGTKAHYEGISRAGICQIHRKTFLKNIIF